MIEADLKARNTGISGTAIGAIIGASPWRQPIEVYRDIVEQPPPTDDDLDTLVWGQELEPLMLRRYERRTTGVRVRGRLRTLRSIEHPWMVGTPDGIAYDVERTAGALRFDIGGDVVDVDDTGRAVYPVELAAGGPIRIVRGDHLVEIKTHGWYVGQQYGEEDTDEVPEHIIAQVTWYMGITGADRCDLAVLSNTHVFRVFRVHRDDRLLAVLMDAGDRFWRHNIAKRIPPSADGSKAHGEYLREHSVDVGLVMKATPDAEMVVRRLARVRRAKKFVEKREALIAQQVMELLGGHTVMTDANDKPLVTWKRDMRGKVSHKDVAQQRAIRLGMTDAEIESENDQYRGIPSRPLKLAKEK